MKFSIIIPAHNSEAFIQNALESIRKQTYKDYELIVICDACTDQTEKIAKEYGARTESVNFHCDGLARNRGMELAAGEWILFMDDDDWWIHEYVLDQLAEKIDECPFAEIICFSFIFRHVGYARPIRQNGHHWIAAWSKCYKRQSIGDARFGDSRDGSADVQFFGHIFDGSRIHLDWDMPMYYYNYWRDNSISCKYTPDLRGKDIL